MTPSSDRPVEPKRGADGERHWLVVNTQPHREGYAEHHLLRQNFRVYSPRLSKSVRHARQTKVVLRPLFPGYLFVEIDLQTTQWRPIASTFGVRRIVRFGDKLGLMPEAFIASLRAREQGGAIVRPREPFKAGDCVRVIAGAFAGTVARVLEASDGDRVMILLELLQREIATAVDISTIRRAGTFAEV